MRTTLDLDDDLMARLTARFPGASKTRAVETALEGFLAEEVRADVLALHGAFSDIEDVRSERRAGERMRAERLDALWRT